MLTNIPVLHTEPFNYNTWTRGKEVATGPSQRCDYWFGHNSIRETPRYYYLLITGTVYYDGAAVFSHFVHRVEKKVLAGQDMQALANELNTFDLDQNAEYLTVETD